MEQCERAKDHALEVYEKRFRRTTRIPDEDDEEEEEDDDEEEQDKRKASLRKKCRSIMKKLKNIPIESELLERTYQIALEKANETFYHDLSSVDASDVVQEYVYHSLTSLGISLENQRLNVDSFMTNTRTPTLEHRYRDKLSEEVNDKIEHFRKTNDDASRTYCNTLSKTMLATLKENLSCEKIVEVMNAYRDFLVYALDVYEDLSLGPSRWEVWSRFTSTDCAVPLLEKMSSVSESISLDKIASENKNSALQSEIESAKQKAIDTNAAFDQERKSFEKEVERLTSEFESEKGRLKSLLESKSSELERTLKNTERDAEEKKQLKEKIETMRDEHRAQLQKKEDEKSKLTRKYDARISDLNREIVDTVKKSNEEKMKQQEEKIKMESKLTNLENDFKRLKDDHQREIEKKEESHRVRGVRKL